MLILFFRSIISILILLIFSGLSVKEIPSYSLPETCVSAEEMKLYDLINEYRKKKKLPKIPLSKSLTFVAQTHSKDLMENEPVKGNCNGHSWSSKGNWTSCCYTPDHKEKECMWNKPKELTSYTSNGYEIAYYSSAGASAEQALAIWQKSKGHNPLLINSGIWKEDQWNAIGIGIYKNYATVWFGVETDKEGTPGKCLN